MSRVKFLLLIYRDGRPHRPDPVARRAEDGFQQELRESGELVSADGLADPVTVRTVRVGDGGTTVAAGPGPHAGRQPATFLVVDCETLDRAVELAARAPAARGDGVEVWPLMDCGGLDL